MTRPLPVWLSVIVAVLAPPAMVFAILLCIHASNVFRARFGPPSREAAAVMAIIFLLVFLATVIGRVYMWCRKID
jgi:hypothetical protein